MIACAGQPILTAAQTRAAEERAIRAGRSVEALMQRAGEGIAAAALRFAAGQAILVACGPGNNGGDGYVAATLLAAKGQRVRVAASSPPRTAAAMAARARWAGPVEPLEPAAPAALLIDALFGTGARPLDPAQDATLARLAAAARLILAVDLPSGSDADTASAPDWAEAHPATLTLALGALKPAHVLHPAAAACGAVRRIDLDLLADETVAVASAPQLPEPGPTSHKYTRGMVAIVTGAMAGAARLAGIAGLRSGAGYVALYGDAGQGGPAAIVHRDYDAEALAESRIGAVLIGPGLGRDAQARDRLTALLAGDRPLVIDGDALHLTDPERLRARRAPVVLTPHAGEFRALFGTPAGSLLDQARAAAAAAGAIVVLKGATTIVADAARCRVHPHGNPWLSTAGSGDVLAGTIAAQIAHPHADPFAAADAGVWLHARAAAIAGRSFLADDLANALTAARATA
ncbi:NAD(P)H-hydrate dehydratase [Sphingomonas sp. CV7422]|uniref:NAD(P)H-hydrate dehydratase n=1 Tax=Sphingomonas sp. CV7422 TaxID=3018036 RepID=UPI0022FE4B83|nr:NAD(P)H-hydrate dehydratase [Sphingomonas sp. CV7422]